MTGFFYQRSITISRIFPVPVTGTAAYRSADQWQEQIIVSDLACNIRMMSHGAAPLADVPGDVVGRGMWRFVFPLGSTVTTYDIRKDDVATDDLGRRFKLMAPDWKSAGGLQIDVELLVA